MDSVAGLMKSLNKFENSYAFWMGSFEESLGGGADSLGLSGFDWLVVGGCSFFISLI